MGASWPSGLAVAKLTVEFIVDVQTLRDAEKMLDVWMSNADDDDRLIRYEVQRSDWIPSDRIHAQTSEAPCGCKWYADGTVYRCLSHGPSAAPGVPVPIARKP